VRYDRPELIDRLAAEYALGTLHGGARRRFEKLLVTNRALRDAVSAWQDRLAPLGDGLDPVAPPPELLARIERSIGFASAPASAPAPATSRAGAREADKASRRASFWQRFFGMPQLGMLAAGLVIGIGVATLASRLLPTAGEESTAQLPQSYAGILSDAEGRATMLVSSLRHGKIADIKVLRPIAVPPGKKLMLWAVPAEGPPFLIGEVPASGKASVRLAGTSEQLLSKVTTLAVSIEPGTGMPPSEFILKGPCAKFW
jgi:anti-sigma-K factor RskA